MSAAKALAEARRAKILARTNKTVAAVNDEEEEVLNIEVGGKSKERPLAMRRSMLKTIATNLEESADLLQQEKGLDSPQPGIAKNSIENNSAPSGNETATAVDPHADPDVETIDEAMSKLKEQVTPKKKEYVYVKKSIKEIEKEVAENTQKFDDVTLGNSSSTAAPGADSRTSSTTMDESNKGSTTPAANNVKSPVLSKETKEESSSSPSKDDSTMKTTAKKDSSSGGSSAVSTAGSSSVADPAAAAAATAAKKKLTAAREVAVNPQSVVRFVRVILVMLFATYSAYVSVRAFSTTATSTSWGDQSTRDEFSDTFDYNSGSVGIDVAAVVIPPRTWSGWLRSYVECSVSAMTVAWWVSTAATPAIYRKFNMKEQKSGIMSTVMSLYSNGVEGILEYLYVTLGEISLHAFTTMIATLAFTVLFSDAGLQSLSANDHVNSAVTAEL